MNTTIQITDQGLDKKQMSFCTDFENSIVVNSFKNRGWKQVTPSEAWNIYWSNTLNCRLLFNTDSTRKLNNNQLINHFPNHYELVRKDLLFNNINRYRKELQKKGNPLATKTEILHKNGQIVSKYLYLDFIPMTFVLPQDYNMFIEQYRKFPQTMWILKPCGKSQGNGIHLVNNLAKLKKWSFESKKHLYNLSSKDTYVVSRYIDNPLLIGGKKFDLRIYIVVTSFYPLKAYMFRGGFCRFCSIRYDSNVAKIDNLFIHLTNVSVQKLGEDYNIEHGGKLSLQNFKLYLEGTKGQQVTKKLFEDIQWLIVHSLKAVASVMNSDKHCFECYGYDIIVDENLKPWLIEVNASPSMAATTISDRILKCKLIESLLSLILPPNGIPDVRWNKIPSKSVLEDFEILIQENETYKPKFKMCKRVSKCSRYNMK